MSIQDDDRTEAETSAETEAVDPTSALLADVAGTNSGFLQAIVIPVLAVFTALVAGALVLVFTDPDLWEVFGSVAWFTESWEAVSGAYGALFRGSFGSTRAISETLVAASPVILAGLSVAIGFRAGLFNIGGEGQILIGGMFSVYIGITFTSIPFPLLALVGLVAVSYTHLTLPTIYSV